MKDDQLTPEPTVLNFAVEYPPNRAIVCIHVSAKIPDIGFYSKPATDEAQQLRDSLLSIDGVVNVYSHDQHVSITRGGVYKWPAIVSQAVEKLRLFANCDTAEEVSLYA